VAPVRCQLLVGNALASQRFIQSSVNIVATTGLCKSELLSYQLERTGYADTDLLQQCLNKMQETMDAVTYADALTKMLT